MTGYFDNKCYVGSYIGNKGDLYATKDVDNKVVKEGELNDYYTLNCEGKS